MEKAKKEPRLREPWTKATPNDCWLDITTRALIFLGKTAGLADLYEVVGQHPKVKGRKESSWRGKLRQQLEVHPAIFVRVGEGRWSFVSLYTAAQLEKFNELRRTRWPRRSSRRRQSA